MTSVRKLVFGEGLMAPTIRGPKTATIRRYRPEAHDFKKGEVFVGEFKDGLNILMQATADTETKPVNKLGDSESRESGFKDAKDARIGLRHWYPDLKMTEMAAIIRHEVLKVNDTPVVTFNEHAQEG